LLVAQLLDLILQRFAVCLFGLVQRLDIRGSEAKVNVIALAESEFSDVDVHTVSLVLASGIAARVGLWACAGWRRASRGVGQAQIPQSSRYLELRTGRSEA
jgi:hypothetical protein